MNKNKKFEIVTVIKEINYSETLLSMHDVIYLSNFSWHKGREEYETVSITKIINNLKLATKLPIDLSLMHI